MKNFTWSNMRQQSHWLVLANSFLIVAGAIALTLLWPAGSGGLALDDDPPSGDAIFMWGDYQSPQRCRECHEAEFQAWSNTSHAKALFDPIFQVYLQQVEQPGECFACHATGYDTATGQFVLAGVTCEACHGPYRPEHPQQSMIVARSEALCSACHPSTLAEWGSSRHGQVGVSWVACHEVHTQQTRAAATTNALCFTCHLAQTQDATHAMHTEADVHCVDCHLVRPNNDGGGAINGRAITGHSFSVFVKTCNDCHTDVSLQILNFESS